MRTDEIHIVGGGVVGLCTALYLSRKGFKVCVIDKGDFIAGTSFGNAGMVVPSHFVPMAAPGVVGQGLKWMLKPESPFSVKLRPDFRLWQWLWQFYRAANEAKAARAMPVLYRFNDWSRQLYKELSEEPGFNFYFEEKGLLMLYKTAHQAKDEAQMLSKAQELGIRAELHDRESLRRLEPEIELDVLGGVYFPDDAHLYPDRLMSCLVQALKQNGVELRAQTAITGFVQEGRHIRALTDTSGNEHPVKHVLLASGSWTAQLLARAGVKLLLQDGKGYSITLHNPPLRPRIPTILTEARVAITPMGSDLRIGGTLELSGLAAGISPAKLKGIAESIPAHYPNLNIPEQALQPAQVWKGYRPCTPDGLPYIGRIEAFSNLTVATGHGMMGLSLGAATGMLVSQLLSGESTGIDIELFAPERFG